MIISIVAGLVAWAIVAAGAAPTGRTAAHACGRRRTASPHRGQAIRTQPPRHRGADRLGSDAGGRHAVPGRRGDLAVGGADTPQRVAFGSGCGSCPLGASPHRRGHSPRAGRGDQPGIDARGDRDRGHRRRRRVDPRAEPLDPRVPAGGDPWRLVRHQHHQGHRRPITPDHRSARRRPWPLVPERALVDGGRTVRGAGAARRPATVARRASDPGRASRSGWPLRSPAAACCSTCTGYPTSLPG